MNEKTIIRKDLFFGRMITKEEWDDPDLLMFTNADIPVSSITLGTHLQDIINSRLLENNENDLIEDENE